MEIIHSLEVLVDRISEGLKVRSKDIEAGSKILDSFYYAPPDKILAEITAYESGSRESYEAQMRLIYEPIAGHRHSITMEGLETPVETAICPFPFSLSPRDAGYWTMAYGYLLSRLDLPTGSKVLEIGSGPGGLTELLCRSRLTVTIVEPRLSNCDYIKSRVAPFGGAINTICDDVQSAKFEQLFDAIIFYEAFHHMPAPKALLTRLKDCLKPDGVLVFGAEPIQPPGPLIPFPWGFRMNGGSLSAIRDVGWVEFGFHEDFFRAMLDALSFDVAHHSLPGFGHCDVWIATRRTA